MGMVAIVTDITHRRRGERRLAAQHAVTAALAESATLEEAGPRVVEELCRGLGWDVGRVWIVNCDDGVLEPVAAWGDAPDQSPRSFEASGDTRLGLGEGLAIAVEVSAAAGGATGSGVEATGRGGCSHIRSTDMTG